MEVTLSGMMMLVRLVQSRNAQDPMEVPLVKTTVFRLLCGIKLIAKVGMVALSMFLQLENAKSPMEVTLSGMAMLVRLKQYRNA